MEYNRSSSDIFKAEAVTTNTFSIKDTEGTLRKTLENSFSYLKKLQKSYIDLKKFVKSEDDFYMDNDGNLCLSLDKDFIHSSNRKAYRTSEFYNKYIDIQTIQNNRNIFSYTPIIFIDGKSFLLNNSFVLFSPIFKSFATSFTVKFFQGSSNFSIAFILL